MTSKKVITLLIAIWCALLARITLGDQTDLYGRFVFGFVFTNLLLVITLTKMIFKKY